MLKITFLVSIFVLALGYTVLVSPRVTTAEGDGAQLFSLNTSARPATEADKSSIGSVREAEILFPSDVQTVLHGKRLAIALFDNKQFHADVKHVETRASDDLTWRGKIKTGDIEGDVVITFRKGIVSGLIYAADSVYEIVPRGDKHILVEIDQRKFPECGGGIAGPESERGTSARSADLIGADSGDRIDVIVVYTTATKNFLGGDAQAQAHAQASIDSTNTAYINSKIRQRLRLVHTQEFVYTESGNSNTDLTNLRNNAGIIALRETHKADLVAEISEVTGVCGIGYLLSAQGGTSNNAFTVTARSCAVGNLSFAHELGHNMGSHHNPQNAGTPIFPFGFGHYVNASYRTVMSYVDPCPNGCTRRPYFSNPSVIFNNEPTGLENARDNARMINTTADWVSNYRYSGSSITLSSLNGGGGEWLSRLVSRDVTWTSDLITGDVRIDISRDESSNWETVIASTPNDGTERILVGGRSTRRGRIRVVSLSSPAVSDSSVANVILR